ncbi:hypothetical protein OUZ56_007773 [Daphnia magna]|uniref:Uncharacterized protein n=1 Tax=Daphnia magna TaxID=35525 RepID=A0ABR0AB96_9CRUS|nr:hypothetical protein OUZ56_007773 [Daphnia magna]
MSQKSVREPQVEILPHPCTVYGYTGDLVGQFLFQIAKMSALFGVLIQTVGTLMDDGKPVEVPLTIVSEEPQKKLREAPRNRWYSLMRLNLRL